MPRRRFPPPWSIEELNDACFIVRDANGQQLAYVYFEEEPGRRFQRQSCWAMLAATRVRHLEFPTAVATKKDSGGLSPVAGVLVLIDRESLRVDGEFLNI